MNKTKIEWCDSTVNPVIGCTFNCPYCYARTMNNRFKWTDEFSKPQFRQKQLEKLKNKKSQNIFMDSMSDVADWKDDWIKETFSAIYENTQHNYLFLTKRPELAPTSTYKYNGIFNKHSDNIWFGVSINTQADIEKNAKQINNIQGNVFLSIEPLHSEIHLNKIDIGDVILDYTKQMGYYLGGGQKINIPKWIIIGAETGNRKNKIIPQKEWIDNIVNVCKQNNTPIFMKDSLLKIMGEENMLREFPKTLNEVK